MTLRFPRQDMRLVLRWLQRCLLLFAGSMLAYCGFVLVDSWIFQKEQNTHLEALVGGSHSPGARAHYPADSETSGLMGRLDIPRLGISAIVMEGTTSSILRHALGHISGTGLPGRRGNIAISGHRDTFFRPLRNIRVNDGITLTTPLGEFPYRVTFTEIVSPSDVGVLDPGDKETLTLISCYPFYFVGPAPYRFVVRAEREEPTEGNPIVLKVMTDSREHRRR